MTESALHSAQHLGPPRRLRVVAAVLVLGAAVAGAVTLYSHRFLALDCGQGICSRPDEIVVKPGWVGPTALALCLLGVAAAVGLLTLRLRLATALLILGAALSVATVIYHDPRAQLIDHTCLPNGGASCTPWPQLQRRYAWLGRPYGAQYLAARSRTGSRHPANGPPHACGLANRSGVIPEHWRRRRSCPLSAKMSLCL
jgi:hypothetical protein